MPATKTAPILIPSRRVGDEDLSPRHRRQTRPRPRHSWPSSPLPKRLRARLEQSAKKHERGEETKAVIEARLAAAERKRQVRSRYFFPSRFSFGI
jgi:hypothetical protein